MDLTHRRAVDHDLPHIVALLAEDELGQTRESSSSDTVDQRYVDAFKHIQNDPNQYLIVVEQNNHIIGTCHLTLMPSLTFMGSTRLQIEAVRVSHRYRGQGIGKWMISQAIDYGKSRGASIIQLTTNKQRHHAKAFYESMGFQATHEGMKIIF
jgi:ribosomal protein S18 acetylase RimI-like enzyme